MEQKRGGGKGGRRGGGLRNWKEKGVGEGMGGRDEG